MVVGCTIQDAFVSASKIRISLTYSLLYLYQPGTDTLDFLFSILRKISHSKNFDYLELMEKFSFARESYQPEIDFKIKRIKAVKI